MSTDQLRNAPSTLPMQAVPTSAADSANFPAGTYRPARPAWGPGRWFRACAGIEEDVMDWAPSERLKYAGVGIIVLNTGCLAAFAMFTALGKVISAPAAALIPVSLIWGWMIFSVDRWLITSTHGMRGTNRVLVFIPRIVLAILLAFTIAEPLTLRIFQNSLNTQVATTRTARLDTYESLLQTCNPVSGKWVAGSACVGNHLAVADSPYAMQQKLATAKQQVADLKPIVANDMAQLRNLQTTMTDECAGTSGPGLTGHAGYGPMCKADKNAIDSYGRQSDVTGKQAQLTAAQNTVAALIPQVAAAQQAYATQLQKAIKTAVTVKQRDLGQIGIIDEWTALEQLSSQSAFVFFGHWLLVLVLMALDCLPVLVKLMGGSSAYDQLLADQIASDERVHAIDLRLREEMATVDKEVEIYLLEMRKRERKQNEDRAERVRNAQGDTDGLDDVRILAAKWRREG
jgi:uncharacterized protein DUF4407